MSMAMVNRFRPILYLLSLVTLCVFIIKYEHGHPALAIILAVFLPAIAAAIAVPLRKKTQSTNSALFVTRSTENLDTILLAGKLVLIAMGLGFAFLLVAAGWVEAPRDIEHADALSPGLAMPILILMLLSMLAMLASIASLAVLIFAIIITGFCWLLLAFSPGATRDNPQLSLYMWISVEIMGLLSISIAICIFTLWNFMAT